MRIRPKLTLLLVSVALAPLLVVTIADLASTRQLGRDLTAQTTGAFRERAASELTQLVDQFSDALEVLGLRIELMTRVQAAEMTRLLRADPAALPPGPDPIYTSDDFDPPVTPGLTVVELPDTYSIVSRTGEQRPLPVSFDHPVFVAAPGAELSPEQTRLTAAALPAMRTIFESDASAVASQFVALESGVHMSFPGKGNFPPGYDPRERGWYTRAAAEGGIGWESPVIDAPTRQIRLTCSMPFFDAEGQFAGVTGVDITMLKLFGRLRLPETIAADAVTLAARIEPTDGAVPRLVVVGSRSHAEGDIPWRFSATQAELRPEPGDEAAFASMASDLDAGRTATRVMSYRGRLHLWGYGTVAGDVAVLVLVPIDLLLARVNAIETDFASHTRRKVRSIVGSSALALAVVVLVAYVASRNVTRPVRKLLQTVELVADGDFDARARVRSRDELGKLAGAVNDMIPRVGELARVRQSLNLAMEVQQSLLPAEPPELPGFDLWGATRYCDETGGDYFDFLDLTASGARRWGVAVGDVSGHGVPAALLMTSARALLQSRALESSCLGEALVAVNRALYDDARHGHFMTLLYLVIDLDASTIESVCAGHDPGLVIAPDGSEPTPLPLGGLPLGIDRESVYEVHRRALPEPGEVLIIGTDGIWELRNRDDEMFGKQRLIDFVRAHAHEPAEDIGHGLFETLAAFRGERRQDDDITFVIVKRTRDETE